jgi:hypothetical protein
MKFSSWYGWFRCLLSPDCRFYHTRKAGYAIYVGASLCTGGHVLYLAGSGCGVCAGVFLGLQHACNLGVRERLIGKEFPPSFGKELENSEAVTGM